jgi:hypothetical protein
MSTQCGTRVVHLGPNSPNDFPNPDGILSKGPLKFICMNEAGKQTGDKYRTGLAIT